MEKRSTPFWFVLFSLAPSSDAVLTPGASMAAMKLLQSAARWFACRTRRSGCDQNGIGDPSRAVKSKVRPTKIVAVFFENDGSTPMTLPPTEVVFVLEEFVRKPPNSRP